MGRILRGVRKAIKESGLSRYAISKATGIDQGQLSHLMKGKVGLGWENLEKLAGLLELEIIVQRKRKKG